MSAQNTRVVPVNDETIAEAAELIRAGLPVAVPTETVYGLAADATNPEAVARIFEAKGRPAVNPLIVHVRDIDQAATLGVCVEEEARYLAKCYWPGPLTLVLPVNPFSTLPRSARAGLDTVGLRAPAHPAIRALLEATGLPLAAPSANASGRLSPTRADHVLASLAGKIALILDGGETAHGIESTIVKLRGNRLTLLRPGPIDFDGLAMHAKLAVDTAWDGRIEAPGQLASHYAPSKPVRLDALEARSGEWLIGFGPVAGDDNLSPSGDPEEAAARLFEALHRAEREDRPGIAVAPIPDEGIGLAVNDRLRRAAAPRGES
ncbi:MAG TPA: L-threonylcarbamoyladenylate synthase [Allosphingosinicella sp.]